MRDQQVARLILVHIARLFEKLPDQSACRIMVDLLTLAHHRGCEPKLASILESDLAVNQLPNMAALRERFVPDPATLPEVLVHLTPLSVFRPLIAGVCRLFFLLNLVQTPQGSSAASSCSTRSRSSSTASSRSAMALSARPACRLSRQT
jgi:hypothetical protein